MEMFALVNNKNNGIRVYNSAQMHSYYTIYNRLKLIGAALKNSIQIYKRFYYQEQSIRLIQNDKIKTIDTPHIIEQHISNKQAEKGKQVNNTQKDKTRQPHNSLFTINNSKKDKQSNRSEIYEFITVKKCQINNTNKSFPKQPTKPKEHSSGTKPKEHSSGTKPKEHSSGAQIDLNDCAYMPDMGISQSQLAVMRQQLLSRGVEQWREGEKERRDRRELRMLNK